MTVNVRALPETFRALTPPVVASMALAVAGLVIERALIPQRLLQVSNEVIGSYLQTLGTVYAVLLAFVVFVVWNQFNTARGYVEEEANELLDLSRTARGFSGDLAPRLHRHIRRYVDAVLGPEWTAMEADCDPRPHEASAILDDLWAELHRVELTSACESAMYSEILGRLNDLSDARAERIASSRLRIPLALWVLLQFGAVITVASMYLFTVERFATHCLITAALAGVISHVLYVIRDLDNCFSGAWRVPRAPFEDVRAYLARCHGCDAPSKASDAAPDVR
jgi:hypothetical protein